MVDADRRPLCRPFDPSLLLPHIEQTGLQVLGAGLMVFIAEPTLLHFDSYTAGTTRRLGRLRHGFVVIAEKEGKESPGFGLIGGGTFDHGGSKMGSLT